MPRPAGLQNCPLDEPKDPNDDHVLLDTVSFWIRWLFWSAT